MVVYFQFIIDIIKVVCNKLSNQSIHTDNFSRIMGKMTTKLR